MKRLHVHVAVENLEQAVRFYTGLFGARRRSRSPITPKWMLDDPRVNFRNFGSRGHAGLEPSRHSD